MSNRIILNLVSNKIIKQNKDLQVCGHTVFCNSCEKIINYDKTHLNTRFQQHVKSLKHKKNKDLKSSYKEQEFT